MTKFREALRKVYPSVDWERIKAEYNTAVNAELKVDDALDIEDLLGEDIPLIEGVHSAAERPTFRGGEAVLEEDPRER